MSKSDLVRHLRKKGCTLHRQGKKHEICIDKGGEKISTVPRHNEIKRATAKKICEDLGIQPPIGL